MDEARVQLKKEAGVTTAFLRLRALPCTSEVHEFINKHERTYIVEANRDGQLRQILTLTMPEYATKLRAASHSDGLPLTARWIKETILAQEAKP